jgi:hypothetical protein
VNQRVGDKLKSVWGIMTEKGGIFKNSQTQKVVLESKLHKSILVDCVFINSMLKMTLIINYAKQFKVPPLNTLTPPHPHPGSYASALLIDFTEFQKNFTKLNTTFYPNCSCNTIPTIMSEK